MSPVNEPATPRYEIVSLLRLALHSWQRLKATRWSTSSPCWRRDAHVYALGDVVSAQNVLNCWSQVKRIARKTMWRCSSITSAGAACRLP